MPPCSWPSASVSCVSVPCFPTRSVLISFPWALIGRESQRRKLDYLSNNGFKELFCPMYPSALCITSRCMYHQTMMLCNNMKSKANERRLCSRLSVWFAHADQRHTFALKGREQRQSFEERVTTNRTETSTLAFVNKTRVIVTAQSRYTTNATTKTWNTTLTGTMS